MIGPENINKHESGLYIAKNLGEVATETSQISLALAAQDSMQIAAELAGMEEYNLPRMFIEVGESRAGMIAPAKEPHAKNLDIQNVYYDLTDPNIAENIRKDKRNLINLPLFLLGLAADMPPVALDLMRRGSLTRERGTLMSKAEYLGAAVLGTLPALLSGEAGESPKFLPSRMPVHLASFKRNPLSNHEEF